MSFIFVFIYLINYLFWIFFLKPPSGSILGFHNFLSLLFDLVPLQGREKICVITFLPLSFLGKNDLLPSSTGVPELD